MFGLFTASIGMYGQQDSSLQSGKWIKVGVTQPGFFRLNQSWFNKYQLKINNPESIAIYGTQSGMLAPEATDQAGKLKAIPAFYQDTNSAIWDVLFWGDAPHKIEQKTVWKQESNRYSDTTFYFIRIDADKPNRIEEIPNTTAQTPYVPFAWSLKHYEPETYNLIQSGQTWLGDAFYGTTSKILQYALPDYLEGKPAFIQLKLHASSVGPSTFGMPILSKSISMDPILGGRYDTKTSNQTINAWITPVTINKNWSFPIQFQSNGGTGYIDYVSFMYPKAFDARHENVHYLLPNTTDSTLNISIPNVAANQQIWINNGGGPWKKMLTNSPFQYKFQPNSQIAVAKLTAANEPSFCGILANQNTFSIPGETELIIISSPTLQEAAEKLAQYKTDQKAIKAKSISTSVIYNDFSGGKQDVTAIRNFVRYQYQKADSKLKYVILLGDASIDYKGQSAISTAIEKRCFVPTYQSQESFQPLLSYSSDDYFGIVGLGAGEWQEGPAQKNAAIEVAVGRIPAKSPQEAQMFINKLMDYEAQVIRDIPQLAWVSDDGDSNIHMQDAEDFSSTLEKALFPGQQHKVYLDQYPMQQTNGVYTSPLGTQAVLKLINEKADFIHYMGHGSESGWADEKLLTKNDLLKLKNNKHLPILLTATCQFGRYDDPNILSGGEISLLSDQGGAIALISTTRPVFQSSNYLFGQAFYRVLLKNKGNSAYRLGDLFREAKNQSQSGVINRNIQLLGDPTLQLPWAAETLELQVDTLQQLLKIKGIPVKSAPLTIQLHRMSDSKKTLGTKNSVFQYETMSPILWKSVGQSTTSTFNISLKNVPKLLSDQRYQLKVWSDKASASIPLHAWKKEPSNDRVAPTISIQLPDENIQATSPNPWVKVTVSDSSGLAWQNIAGQIAYLIIDDSIQVALAPRMTMLENNSKKGEARIQLKSLTRGNHKIQVICWDINNNQAQASLSFQVITEDPKVLNGRVYPNPLGKTFHFVFEQEKPWNRMPYELQIINLQGQVLLQKSGTSNYQDGGLGIIEFDWNEEEFKHINQPVVLQIMLNDGQTKDTKIFRIKSSTLK